MISTCGQMYVTLRCEKCGNVHKSYLTCKKRTCEMCARKRAKRLVKAFSPIVSSFSWPAFMTLTLPSVESRDVIKQKNRLIESFAKLRRWKEIGFKKGVYTIEILKKNGDYWYLHLHALIDCKWLDQKILSDIWKKITGDASIVDIRRVSNTQKACMEVLKYQTKMWELDDKEKEFIDKIFSRSRFVGSFGIKRPEAEPYEKTCSICGGRLMLFEDWADSGKRDSQPRTFDDDG